MKSRLLAPLVACLCLSLALPSASAAPATTLHHGFKDRFATALFVSVDPSGCLEMETYIDYGIRQRPGTGQGQARPTAFVVLSQYDLCQDRVLLDASGEAVVAASAGAIGKDLRSAALSTTVPVRDPISGASWPVTVEIAWLAVGSPSVTHGHDQVNTPGFKINARFDGVSSSALSSGRVVAEARDFAPTSTGFGFISSTKGGEVVIIH